MNAWKLVIVAAVLFLSACGGGSDAGSVDSDPDHGGGPPVVSTPDAETPVYDGGTPVVPPPPPVVDPKSACYVSGNPAVQTASEIRVNAAVKNGDPSSLLVEDRPTLLQCAVRKAAALQARPQQILADIYNTNGTVPDLSIDIGRYSNAIKSTGLSGAIPYIVSDKGNGIAAIVELSSDDGTKTGRGMAYGGDVLNWMAGTSTQQQHLPLFTRAFTWLMTGSASGALPASIKFSKAGYGNANAVKNFVARIPGKTATEVTTCDITDPSPANTCWQDLDLLVFGESVQDKGGLEDLVRTYMKAGKAVMYMHNDWNNGAGANSLLGGMGMAVGNTGSGNWFEPVTGYSVASGRTAADSLARADQVSKLITTLNLLQQPSYSKDFSTDTTPIDGINLALNDISGYETRGKQLFAIENTDLQRLLVLWADSMRIDVAYGNPQLNRTNYPANFLRAYASDSWLAFRRTKTTTNSSGQGDYMPVSAQSLSPSVVDETIVLTLPQASGKTAIGRGALPAKAVAIQVVGTLPAGLSIGVQTSYLRAVGNPLKDNNDYKRPRQPQSWVLPIYSGVTNDFVSPAGGPLFLNYSGATAGQKITLKIKGVIKYAHFDFSSGTPSQAELDAAMAAVQRQDYGWATFKSRSAEVQQTIATALNSFKANMPTGTLKTPQDLVANRMQGILMETNHITNGYNDMPMASAVQALCTTFGWACGDNMHNAPGVQHFVSWIAQCGSGCSGQPSDNNGWALNATWGWAHELGHNTVQSWMHTVMPNGKGCTVECDNNVLSSANMMRLYAMTGDDFSNTNTGFPALYKMIQDNRASYPAGGEAMRADMATRLWEGDQNAMRAVHFQLAFLYAQTRRSEANPTSNSTIEFFTLLSKGGRLVANTKDATQWNADRVKYGLGSYTSNAIENRDLLYVLGSRIIGQDLRNVFFMYGIPLAQTSLDSVASLNLCVARQKYYQLAADKSNQPSTGVWGSLESAQTPVALSKCSS